jgi:hypothetical protein
MELAVYAWIKFAPYAQNEWRHQEVKSGRQVVCFISKHNELVLVSCDVKGLDKTVERYQTATSSSWTRSNIIWIIFSKAADHADEFYVSYKLLLYLEYIYIYIKYTLVHFVCLTEY